MPRTHLAVQADWGPHAQGLTRHVSSWDLSREQRATGRAGGELGLPAFMELGGKHSAGSQYQAESWCLQRVEPGEVGRASQGG